MRGHGLRTAVRVAIGIAGAALVWAAVDAAPQAPRRDAPSALGVGSAAISGIVVSSNDSRTPIRRATLALTRSGANESRLTATDDAGRFLFDRLPAGTYLLAVSKGAYVSTSYGSPRSGLPGNPIPLTDGQRFITEPIELLRGAVLSGRLLDVDGTPIVRQRVRAVRVFPDDGVRRLRPLAGDSGSDETDAVGEYRIYGLPPGRYVIGADTRVRFQAETRQVTPAEIAWARQLMGARSQAAFAPRAPGRTDGIAPAPAPADPVVLTPTYYPGTAEASAAVTLDLAAGDVREGLDFTPVRMPAARVIGTVGGLDDPEQSAIVSLRSGRSDGWLPPLVSAASVAPAGATPGRQFVFTSVPPGDHTLMVRTLNRGSRAAGASQPVPMWGRARISVNGADVDGLTIQVQPGVTISGRFRFEDSVRPRPARMEAVRLRITPIEGEELPNLMSPSVVVREDGTFTISGAVPGPYRLRATVGAALAEDDAWLLKSASLDGADVLDAPLDVRAGPPITGLTLTFAGSLAELNGQLVDGAGQPMSQYFVLVFPVDRRFWTPDSRWIKFVRAGTDGTYRITELPAGDYHVCALTEIDPERQFDPDYLEPFMSYSIPMTFGDREVRTQNLRIGG